MIYGIIAEMNKILPQAMFSRLVLSSADGLSSYLDVGSHQTSFGPVGLASGAAPPAFHQTKKIGAFDHTYNLDPTDSNHPTLQIDATDLVGAASSSGLGIDSVSTQATSDVGSANILLTDHPPFALGVLGLSVSATFIHSASSASYVFGANRGFLSGDASFGSLAIGGALIGKTLTFAGDAKANTILFQSSSVTITLDKQIRSEFLPPSAATPTAPNRITTDALDIHLANAHLFGQTITGDITLGETSASLFPPLHA
jgi:hypothetical protein